MSQHITELHDKLVKERDAIDAQIAPLRKRADELRAKIQPLENELRGINEEIKTAERKSGYVGLTQEIGKLAQVVANLTSKNRRRLQAESGSVAVTPTPTP